MHQRPIHAFLECVTTRLAVAGNHDSFLTFYLVYYRTLHWQVYRTFDSKRILIVDIIQLMSVYALLHMLKR